MASPVPFGDVPPTAPLRLAATDIGDGQVVLMVTGEVDMATCDQLDQTVAHLLRRRPRRLLLDLAGVRFLDSSGIRVLLHSGRRAQQQDCHLSLVNTPPAVRRVLEIAGVASLLGLDVDRDDQTEAVSSPDSTR
ncbi:anti-sigma B factor antagonist [Micromonospora sediminicola]|uniref:Anti-sigma factor antagonist n=1 Tax=Micromonospora sediminicola TaxID=946078 RepID=A0A1A9B902_9ACTN|nr:STAS domain-containing protein [Micromonospora sediminicola]SBT65995.1 anti-sigma B factor antagonist [Micromonospora sediminicola]